MKKFIKIGCLVVVILFIMAAATCSYGIYKAKTQYEPEIKPLINKIVESYNANNYDYIYDAYSQEVKDSIKIERNRELISKYYELTGKIQLQDSNGFNVKNFNGVVYIDLKYNYTGEKCSSFISFTYVKNNTWQLQGFNINVK
jgi:hypothetical protein